MARLHASVEADVPIEFAEREWTEYEYRSRFGNYQKSLEDVVVSSINETDADSGEVHFETEDDRIVRVWVDLEYTPHQGGDPDDEIARAQARLERDLQQYRTLLLARCEQVQCRVPQAA